MQGVLESGLLRKPNDIFWGHGIAMHQKSVFHVHQTTLSEKGSALLAYPSALVGGLIRKFEIKLAFGRRGAHVYF